MPNKIEPLEPRIKHLSDFYGKPINPPEYVVDELIPKGRVTLFAGKAGFGKSYAALMLMIAAATERQWLNKNVRKCKSFGLFSEDPDEEIQRRLVNICVYYDIDMRDIEDFAPYLSADEVFQWSSQTSGMRNSCIM
jgi:RecA-family ATPase